MRKDPADTVYNRVIKPPSSREEFLRNKVYIQVSVPLLWRLFAYVRRLLKLR
jgi:hypothetical protein